MSVLHDTYDNHSLADLFVRVFNAINQQGRRMYVYTKGNCQYEVWESL